MKEWCFDGVVLYCNLVSIHWTILHCYVVYLGEQGRKNFEQKICHFQAKYMLPFLVYMYKLWDKSAQTNPHTHTNVQYTYGGVFVLFSRKRYNHITIIKAKSRIFVVKDFHMTVLSHIYFLLFKMICSFNSALINGMSLLPHFESYRWFIKFCYSLGTWQILCCCATVTLLRLVSESLLEINDSHKSFAM